MLLQQWDQVLKLTTAKTNLKKSHKIILVDFLYKQQLETNKYKIFL